MKCPHCERPITTIKVERPTKVIGKLPFARANVVYAYVCPLCLKVINFALG